MRKKILAVLLCAMMICSMSGFIAVEQPEPKGSGSFFQTILTDDQKTFSISIPAVFGEGDSMCDVSEIGNVLLYAADDFETIVAVLHMDPTYYPELMSSNGIYELAEMVNMFLAYEEPAFLSQPNRISYPGAGTAYQTILTMDYGDEVVMVINYVVIDEEFYVVLAATSHVDLEAEMMQAAMSLKKL